MLMGHMFLRVILHKIANIFAKGLLHGAELLILCCDSSSKIINLFNCLQFITKIIPLFSQVECKKAQPKEVMLPANLAKTRTAGRGTYGELVVFSGGPAGVGAGPAGVGPSSSAAAATAAAATHHPQHPHHSASAASVHTSSAAAAAAARELISAPLRYAPYPLPASALAANQQAAAAAAAAAVAATTHILPGTPSLIQYANGQSLLADLTYKRLLAANAAAAASLRPHHAPMVHNQPRATATLTYPIGDLLGAQGLDLSALYPLQAAALGL